VVSGMALRANEIKSGQGIGYFFFIIEKYHKYTKYTRYRCMGFQACAWEHTYIHVGHENNLARVCCARVARWFIFKPKFPIWVNFGGL
jgi:hypothetical protein